MTYDLAVWEGERPAADQAGATFMKLYKAYIDNDADTPPTPAIRALVQALLDRWIDMTDDVDEGRSFTSRCGQEWPTTSPPPGRQFHTALALGPRLPTRR